MTIQSFDSLGLSSKTLAAVASAGYETPTEIQTKSIPLLLDGRDIVGTAQTGTGKTAAFVLPMVDNPALRSEGNRKGPATPTSLILTPTRELALQIVESIGTYGKGSGLYTVALFGGASRNKQIDQLRRHPDVVVATPGRLEDLMAEKFLHLRNVKYLVLDEADRMLDMGFIPVVRRIVGQVSDVRQTALFSATMPDPIRKLAREFLENPVRVEAEAGEVNVERIQQSVLHIDQSNKLAYLPDLIRDRGMYKVLVFTRTKHRARKVAKVLDKKNLKSDSIHGDKSQGARNRALADFRTGKIQVLVATDVASRGIDVDDVTHVVNFEIPNEPETYVHRIGRTARAGADGDAISLCDTTEMKYVQDIERLTGKKMTLETDHPYHEERASASRGQKRTQQQSQPRRNQNSGRPTNGQNRSNRQDWNRPAENDSRDNPRHNGRNRNNGHNSNRPTGNDSRDNSRGGRQSTGDSNYNDSRTGNGQASGNSTRGDNRQSGGSHRGPGGNSRNSNRSRRSRSHSHSRG